MSDNDNLYLLDTTTLFNESLQCSTLGLKRKLTNENSVLLCHRTSGHISIQRIERLVLDEIFDVLDLIDFDICINYIKEKQINKGNLKPTGLWMS